MPDRAGAPSFTSLTLRAVHCRRSPLGERPLGLTTLSNSLRCRPAITAAAAAAAAPVVSGARTVRAVVAGPATMPFPSSEAAAVTGGDASEAPVGTVLGDASGALVVCAVDGDARAVLHVCSGVSGDAVAVGGGPGSVDA